MAHLDYALIKLVEECSEVIKVGAKIQRFGWTSYHPRRHIDNLHVLQCEIHDLIVALENLEKEIAKNPNLESIRLMDMGSDTRELLEARYWKYVQ